MKKFVIAVWLLVLLCSPVSADDHKLTIYATLPDETTLPLAFARWLRAVDAAAANTQLDLRYDNADSTADLTILITPENDALTLLLIPQTQILPSEVLVADTPFTISLTAPISDEAINAGAAVVQYTAGNLTEATTHFTTLYNTVDRHHAPQIAIYLANLAITEDDYAAALKWFSKAPADDPATVVNLAWLYVQTGRETDAVMLLSDALNDATTSDEQLFFYRKRARIHALVYDYTRAVDDMDAAIALAEANDIPLAPLYTQRGEIILLLYEWDRALDNFNTALALDEAYAPAYFQRGILHYTMAQREKALADFERYLLLQPDSAQAEAAQRYIDSINTELEALGG